jgi:hypothetical protein
VIVLPVARFVQLATRRPVTSVTTVPSGSVVVVAISVSATTLMSTSKPQKLAGAQDLAVADRGALDRQGSARGGGGTRREGDESDREERRKLRPGPPLDGGRGRADGRTTGGRSQRCSSSSSPARGPQSMNRAAKSESGRIARRCVPSGRTDEEPEAAVVLEAEDDLVAVGRVGARERVDLAAAEVGKQPP